MTKKILITGGSGFIGSEICRQAVEEGHEVTSISRSGRPAQEGGWLDRVNWVSANVLDPDAWREHLQGCDAVIHCVGTYRDQKEEGLTLERVNDDSTEMVAWEAEHAGVPHFVFLSAELGPPPAFGRFLESKRRAETMLRGRKMHESILRPTVVYGPGRPAATVIARVMQAAGKMPGVGTRMNRLRPLPVEKVAAAALKAAIETGYDGVINVDNIEYLAGTMPLHAGDGIPATSPVRRNQTLVIAGVVVTVAAVALVVAWRRGAFKKLI